MKKLLFVVLLVALLVSPVSAELPPNPLVVNDDLVKEIGVEGGQYVLGLGSSPRSFNYYGTIDAASYTILGNVLTPIVEEDPVTSEIVPGLAKSWDVSEDGTEVTFHLREGVKWSDGKPFTSEDVVFSMRHVVMNPNAEGNSVSRFTLGGEPIRWEAVDELTVRAILPEPYGAFTRVLSHALMVPKHKFEHAIAALNPDVEPGTINQVWTTDTPLSEIVGTGPFVISEYVVDQKVTLTPNPYFWKTDSAGTQLPYLDELVYMIVQDQEVMVAQFRAGNIDRINITGPNYPTLKRAEVDGADFRVLAGAPVSPTPSPPHLAFNWEAADAEKKELFRNDKFRQAMEYTIDRYRIIEDVYNTLAVIPGTPVLPANGAFYNPKVEEIMRPYDMSEAASILDELDIVDRNGDGYRQFPSGNRLEITLTAAVDTQPHNDIAVILRDEWEDLGIRTHLNLVSGNLVANRRTSGEYEAIIVAFGNQADPQLRKAIWQPGRSLYYWHRSTMDDDQQPVMDAMTDWELRVFELFELGEVEMDPDQRKAYYDEWQELYAYHVPVIFIAKGMELEAVSNRVGNVFQLDNGQTVGANYTIYIRD